MPLTSDVAEAAQEAMIQLGERLASQSGGAGTAQVVRARLQSAQLKSDMQAFKAANPRCDLEDFVRWHSPRDWLPEEGSLPARLSDRMREPGNLWAQLWGATLPVAAAQQRPLFDAAREAEIILHQLEVLPPQQLLPQLVACAFEL